MPTSFETEIAASPQLVVSQRREIAELVGFESRNKYDIVNQRGERVGYAAEQQKGILGFLLRQGLGHWRPFDIFIFDFERQLQMVAHHPFRWFFQRLELRGSDGTPLGSVQRRWGLIRRVFDVEDAAGRVLLTVSAPIWRPWTFEFTRPDETRTMAAVRKKWSGLLREAFMDADNFQIELGPGPLTLLERKLLLAAALFIDLLYFENKSSS
jgi:hypothetical protein